MAINTHWKTVLTPHKSDTGGSTVVNSSTSRGSNSLTSQYVESAQIDNLKGHYLNYTDGDFKSIRADNGDISNITGDTLRYNDGTIINLISDNISTGELNADTINAIKANLDQILSKNITTDYLTVNKQAHFFELIIDKIKSVGGSIILSATNCVIDYAKEVKSGNNVIAYDVYWKATDPDGRELTNDWWQYDQAICQSFNVTTGLNQDVSNKYYWRLVTEKNADTYMWLGTKDDIRNGTITTEENSSTNNVTINNVRQTTSSSNTGWQYGWNISEQTYTDWIGDTGAQAGQVKGVMKTEKALYGIELTPNATLYNVLPSQLKIELGNQARLNTTIELQDGTSLYYPAGQQTQNVYTYSLNIENPIQKVIITNADEVMWHKVHSIRLGNQSGQVDLPSLDPDAQTYNNSSIPEAGDSIVQLGYRYNMQGATYDVKRASAIIIAAYNTPDAGINPPSYAQYQNITDFNLANHRMTYLDATRAKFIGDLYVDANTSVQQYVDNYIGQQGGVVGPQGPQGNAGAGSDLYKLISVGAQGCEALVDWSLNSNNEIVQTFSINMKYKVLKIDEGRYLTYSELATFPKAAEPNNGLYAYVKYTKNNNNTPTYRYYKMNLYNPGYPDDDGYYTYEWTGTGEALVANNQSVSVILVAYNPPSTDIPWNDDNIQYALDNIEIPITVRPHAQFQVVQGNQANIASLVVGQQGNATHIAEIYLDMNEIQTTVTGIQGSYVSQSQLTQSEDALHSTITAEWMSAIDAKVEELVGFQNLDANKFYPVAINVGTDAIGARIIVDRTLDADEYGAPSYSTHPEGFVIIADWHTVGGGWVYDKEHTVVQGTQGIQGIQGTNWIPQEYTMTSFSNEELNGKNKDTYRFINKFDLDWTINNKVAGSIRQNAYTNDEIIYLRGGSIYRIRCDYTSATITPHGGVQAGYQGYLWEDSYANPNTGVITRWRREAPILAISDPQIDTKLIIPVTDTMHRSEILQTADSIKLDVYNGLYDTGIDIGHQTIMLKADHVGVQGALGQNLETFSIDGTNGDVSMTGNITSRDIGTQNGFEINVEQGLIHMTGPDSLTETPGGYVPDSGAQSMDLWRLKFDVDPDTLNRTSTQYMYSKNNELRIDPVEGIVFTKYDIPVKNVIENGYHDIVKRIVIDFNGIRYASGTGPQGQKTLQWYINSWDEILDPSS